jgi:glycerol uptake facilitator protein
MSPCLAEIVGTMILIVFGDGVVANVLLKKSKGESSGWIVITTGWAIGVMMGIYFVGRISGAHLNPAVSFSLALLGSFPWSQVPGYIASQIIGGFLEGVLVWLVYLPHWAITESKEFKLAIFCTVPAIRRLPANFLTEVIGTALLIFGILGIGANAQRIAAPRERFVGLGL